LYLIEAIDSGPAPLFALLFVVIVTSERPPIVPLSVNTLAPFAAPRLVTI
jgi:hypothetical protein